jgi:glutaredoxin-like YruB-family protein
MSSVTIYSTPTCTYCQLAKEFFKANGIEYTEIDVAADRAKLQDMVEKSGQMGVPVILAGDNVIVGFDEEKIREILGK